MRIHETVIAAVVAGGAAVVLTPRMPGLAAVLVAVLLAVGAVGALRRLAPPAPPERPAVPLANISHEIRTPLNGILGLTQLLLKMPSTTQQREYLESIRSSGIALLRLLNDILDYSTLRTGRLRFQPERFQLRAWVRETVRSFAPQAHLAGLELVVWVEPDVPDEIVGDPGRLRQVLGNLLVNAIKFTREGDVLLEISVERQEADGALLRFEVIDTGVGVSEEQRSVIFEAFRQGQESSPQGGVGLGLAIAKDLVERMGGRIGLDSSPGHGSTFYFTAALALPVEGSVRDDVDPGGSLSGLEVLIVDDRDVSRTVLEKQMTAWGCRVTTASDAESAVSALRRDEPFSLFLVDSHMPGVDLWSLLEALQKPRQVPGVLMTLSHEHVDVDRMRTYGFLGHLTKPVAATHLIRAIEILRRGRSLDAPEDVQTHQLNRLALGGLRVLLAEDHPINRTIVVKMLERAGSEVEVATNGREALALWRKGRFDIGVLDVQMPEIDGLTLARTIRAAEAEEVEEAQEAHEAGSRDHLPLIALTANAGDADRKRSMDAGMDAFLAKPVQEETLVSTMRRLIGRKERGTSAMFDAPAALSRANGDRALLSELVSLFLQETPPTVAAIESALAASDLEGVERLAHRLRGSLLTFAATNASQAALALETSARSGSTASCAAAKNKLVDALDELTPELRAMATPVESR